jgi:hypothetical protein
LVGSVRPGLTAFAAPEHHQPLRLTLDRLVSAMIRRHPGRLWAHRGGHRGAHVGGVVQSVALLQGDHTLRVAAVSAVMGERIWIDRPSVERGAERWNFGAPEAYPATLLDLNTVLLREGAEGGQPPGIDALELWHREEALANVANVATGVQYRFRIEHRGAAGEMLRLAFLADYSESVVPSPWRPHDEVERAITAVPGLRQLRFNVLRRALYWGG